MHFQRNKFQWSEPSSHMLNNPLMQKSQHVMNPKKKIKENDKKINSNGIRSFLLEAYCASLRSLQQTPQVRFVVFPLFFIVLSLLPLFDFTLFSLSRLLIFRYHLPTTFSFFELLFPFIFFFLLLL